MHIKILGPGCARCNQTEELVRDVVQTRGSNITVEKVSDLKEMMILGVMATPAVVIDRVVKCSGRIPSKEEVVGWIDAG
ncbi:MAG: thioredoxin family protein [bacterium]|nr:thioredoxin family protein [bacterium]